MAAGLIASLIPLLDVGAAGTAAKGTMDMNKKEGANKEILDDGLLSKSDTKVKGESDGYRTLSKAEKDELMIDLVMGGLTTREAMNVIKTGYISKGDLEKIPVPLRRKISRMTGHDLGVQTVLVVLAMIKTLRKKNRRKNWISLGKMLRNSKENGKDKKLSSRKMTLK